MLDRPPRTFSSKNNPVLFLTHSNFCVPFPEGLAPAVPALFPFFCISLFTGFPASHGFDMSRANTGWMYGKKGIHKNGIRRVPLAETPRGREYKSLND